MLILIGALIVVASALGGFMIGGGQPLVLLEAYGEFICIFGIALGVLIIASPGHVLKQIAHKLKGTVVTPHAGREEFGELLKLLYELFMIARRNGVIALEEHVTDPKASAVFKKYPVVLEHSERLEFLCNGLKPVIDGKIKPEQLEQLMLAELEAKSTEADHPVHVLQLVGDSLPGIGIVAAVLGIINTMRSIADGPDKVGQHVAGALTGTLLGVFAAYGFVNPLANRVKFNNAASEQCLRCILQAVAAFAKGLAPTTAIEIARRSLDSNVQPNGAELDGALKELGRAR